MKSTKIIAGLGVAAALGVAALPLATFAANYDGTVTLTANVPGSTSLYINESGKTSATIVFGTINPNAYKASDGSEISNSITVVTSNEAFDLKVQNTSEGADGAMKSGDNTIAPFATAHAPATNASVSGWGFSLTKKVGSAETTTALTNTDYNMTEGKYIAVPTDATTVDHVGAAATETYNYTASYAIEIADGQAAGTYTGIVKYSAVTE